MNNLQKYLDLRGLTAARIAEAAGLGYHSVQKNIKGVRANPSVREAIARCLGLPSSQIWGEGSSMVLRTLIRKEINYKAESEREKLQAKYL